MGQVTIYINDEAEREARKAARAEGLSLSRWVAQRIERRLRGEWPESVRALAGAWRDLPDSEKVRKTQAPDVRRRRL